MGPSGPLKRKLVLTADCHPLCALVPADPDYRAVWQLRSMLICVMPDSWPALEYADYGCYCGLGGSGTPVDELDRCCQTHDHCYSAAMELKACWPVLENPYTLIYHYSCDKANKTVTCEAKNTECEMFVCECDRKASMCFAGCYQPTHLIHHGDVHC
uniref:Phospholipase A2 n=1 Tax=Scleropages formosus TaxID=113540 RepID=A0A8C9TK14_SCLFO